MPKWIAFARNADRTSPEAIWTQHLHRTWQLKLKGKFEN